MHFVLILLLFLAGALALLAGGLYALDAVRNANPLVAVALWWQAGTAIGAGLTLWCIGYALDLLRDIRATLLTATAAAAARAGLASQAEASRAADAREQAQAAIDALARAMATPPQQPADGLDRMTTLLTESWPALHDGEAPPPLATVERRARAILNAARTRAHA